MSLGYEWENSAVSVASALIEHYWYVDIDNLTF